MNGFAHKRLDAYRVAMGFVASAVTMAERVPHNRYFLADQLLRAATAIPLNIAEGAGEYSRKEKARFYNFADAGPVRR